MKSGFVFNLIQEGFSRTYQWTTGDEPYPLRSLLQQEYQHLKPQKILDVGCGSGSFALPGYDYIGIDPNPKYIAYCRKHRLGHFQEMRGQMLEYPDASFDVVLCFSIGHHLDDSQFIPVLKEIKRVLKPHGAFLFADPVRPIVGLPVMASVLEWLDEGDAFRTENEYLTLLKTHFAPEEKLVLVDQFYRTLFLRCRKTQ